MKNTPKVAIAQLVKTFADLFNQGNDCHLRACQVLVQALDQDREATMKLVRSIIRDTKLLALMENVGRGHASQHLLMASYGGDRLLKAPLAQQERLFNTGVAVAVRHDGQLIRVVKSVSELSYQESKRAIDSNGYEVPFEQQKAKLLEVEVKEKYVGAPYRLSGDTLVADANARIVFEELQRLYYTALKVHEQKRHDLEAEMKRRQVSKAA